MLRPSGRSCYSIAAVSKLTGVSCHALRVWERRYGFPVPERTPSGHRRYGKDQVAALIELTKLGRTGLPIGSLIGDHLAGKLAPAPVEGEPAEEESQPSSVVDCLLGGNLVAADALIDQYAARLSPLELLEQVIGPALVSIGERWFRGECQIYQERCATGRLLAKLEQMLEKARQANRNPSRSVIVAAVQGDRHLGGVLMASVALELDGWRALPLGVDVPIEQLKDAVEVWGPDALALSFVLSRNVNKRFRELATIKGIPIFIGGRSIVNHQGLARRHGLIPLVGTLRASVARLIAEFDNRSGRRAVASSSWTTPLEPVVRMPEPARPVESRWFDGNRRIGNV